jgi:hypothetical protein
MFPIRTKPVVHHHHWGVVVMVAVLLLLLLELVAGVNIILPCPNTMPQIVQDPRPSTGRRRRFRMRRLYEH